MRQFDEQGREPNAHAQHNAQKNSGAAQVFATLRQIVPLRADAVDGGLEARI